jgi:hypothetical protein
MLRASNIRLRSFELGHIDIYWDLGPTFEDLYDYDVYVQRSEAEFGPYEDITPAMRGAERFRDSEVRGRHSRLNRLYYRIKVVHRASGEQVEYPELGGVNLAAKPDLIALEMARQETLKLKEFSGRMIWIFPRRRTGQRCTTCYDHVTGRALRADCSTCYGTTWVGGYHPPVGVYAQIQSATDTTLRTAMGSLENQDTVFKLANYPELDAGDLVVELENRRWVVGDSINKVQKGRALVRQETNISLIPVSDIEYRVPLNIDEETLSNLLATPERNYTNPQTLESAALNSAMSILFGKV